MPPKNASPSGRGRPGALRAALLFGLPATVLVALRVLPLVTGQETLVLRDVLATHLMLEAPLAAALRDGVLPLVDPFRGGEPLLGNPNAVPFYPTAALYAVAPVLWVLNAHFWIHWLVAPAAAFFMGRAWGLSRGGAWAMGVCYATSGYFLSHLNLYNLVAGAALAPALVGAALRAAEGRRWALPVTGLLWGLVLLSGDPASAVMSSVLAGSAVLVRWPERTLRPRVAATGATAIGLGTLVALPQIVELLRVLPATYRGHAGFGDGRLAVGAWHPGHAVEWLMPLAYGRYDVVGPGGFWGEALFGGSLPIFLSLYPGILALALVLAAGRPTDRRTGWAWTAAGVGSILACGSNLPLGAWLLGLPGTDALRYPVKLWMLVAVPAALLCGIGWDRTFGSASGERSLRRLGWALGGIATALGGSLLLVASFPAGFESAVLELARPGFTAGSAAAERARWLATFAVLGILLAGLALALLLSRRRPGAGPALLLLLHAGGQLHLLAPVLLTDRAEEYREPPPVAAGIPPGSTVAHAGYRDLFGSAATRRRPPDGRALWELRQDWASLPPGAGVLHRGLRYELAPSPEGLHAFLGRLAFEAVRAASHDADRIRALSGWGVEYVISERPLRGVPEDLATLHGTWPGVTAPVHVYRLPRAAPEVLLAESELRVPHLNAAWDLFRDPAFDPRVHVVMPGGRDAPVPVLPEGPPSSQGRVRVLASGPESLEIETDSPVPAVLVAQRSLLPIWRGTVDGAPVELEAANLYRIGVRVPAGRHRVRLRVDRTPFSWSLAGSTAGALGLVGLAWVGRRRREPEQVERPTEDA